MTRRTPARRAPGARGSRLRALVAGLVALVLAGCASAVRLADVAQPGQLPPTVELDSTPFHPQADQQCGPAALATVLGAAGRAAPLDQLAREIFVPGRAGSLQPELVGAIRARGLLPYELRRDTAELMAEVAGGRPVLVLQKQGVGPWPAWHYAVVIGYDTGRGTFLLRSGTTERLEMRAALFDATWSRADRWAIVTLVPGQLPRRPDLGRYMQAAAALEAVGHPGAARDAYAAAIEHWPDEPLPRLGLANVDAAQGRWSEAERGYAAVLRLDPGSAAALNNRAEALGRLGCLAAARELLAAGTTRLAADDPLRPALMRTAAELEARAAGAVLPEPAACTRLGVR
ncbi:MAG TPA: PA2778 family cysteine peptidase [Steroidobacteraceae bacterium]|nr:PA2778 family cysteine peptidase [Steroidobacteraceae bacterium]